MPLLSQPRKPHSSLYFEVTRQIHSGVHQEWRKVCHWVVVTHVPAGRAIFGETA